MSYSSLGTAFVDPSRISTVSSMLRDRPSAGTALDQTTASILAAIKASQDAAAAAAATAAAKGAQVAPDMGPAPLTPPEYPPPGGQMPIDDGQVAYPAYEDMPEQPDTPEQANGGIPTWAYIAAGVLVVGAGAYLALS